MVDKRYFFFKRITLTLKIWLQGDSQSGNNGRTVKTYFIQFKDHLIKTGLTTSAESVNIAQLASWVGWGRGLGSGVVAAAAHCGVNTLTMKCVGSFVLFLFKCTYLF